MTSANDFDSVYRKPLGELGTALARLKVEDVTISLHCDDERVLWVRVSHAQDALYERIGTATLVIERTHERGPFFAAGSFARCPPGVRRVVIERGHDRLEALAADQGWLCLVPTETQGPVRVAWLDDHGREYQATQPPPLADAGVIGATFYAPLDDSH